MAAPRRPAVPPISSPGEALAWVSALVLALSAFMSWYAVDAPGVTVSVIGWHTGTVGKLVFFVGLVVIAFLFLHATGVELPPTIGSGVVVAVLGAIGTVLLLVRVIDIPERFAGSGRSIGLWIGLAAAVLVIVAGFLKAGEER